MEDELNTIVVKQDKLNYYATLEHNLIDMTMCPICCEFIGTMIYQCSSGHHFCAFCANEMRLCPTCRLSLPTKGIRSRAFEDILKQLIIPCTNTECTVVLPYEQMDTHLSECIHRVISCPYHSCVWSDQICRLHCHIEDDHDAISLSNNTCSIHIDNPEGYAIDMFSEVIIKTISNNYYLIGFYYPKGNEPITQSIIGSIIHLGIHTEHTHVRGHMSIKSKYYGTVNTCVKEPWNVITPLRSILHSRHNLVIDWGHALTSGITIPLYREHDNLHVYPQPSGLNMSIDVNIDENIEQTSIHSDIISLSFKQHDDISF